MYLLYSSKKSAFDPFSLRLVKEPGCLIGNIVREVGVKRRRCHGLEVRGMWQRSSYTVFEGTKCDVRTSPSTEFSSFRVFNHPPETWNGVFVISLHENLKHAGRYSGGTSISTVPIRILNFSSHKREN